MRTLIKRSGAREGLGGLKEKLVPFDQFAQGQLWMNEHSL